MKQPYTCHCGKALTFKLSSGTVTCWCPRCKRLSEEDGHVVFVYGSGKTEDSAAADWADAVNRF